MRALLLFGLLLIGCTDLTIDPPYEPPSQLIVSPDSQLILTGEPFQLEARTYDDAGNQILLPDWLSAVQWATDDPRVIVYDGEVIGSRGGTVRVTASAFGLSDGVTVRLNPSELEVAITLALNQSVQDPMNNVPLIAGRGLVFRVFMTAEETNFYESVDIRATFILGEREWHTNILSLQTDSISSEIIDKGLYSTYFDSLVVPGSMIEQGTVLELEIDPEGRLDPRLLITPKLIRFNLDVINVPIHRQMVIPTLPSRGGTNEIIALAESFVRDTIGLLRSIYPINEMEVEQHALYRTDIDLCEVRQIGDAIIPVGWYDFINEIEFMRIAEGRQGWYYLGVVTTPDPRGAGSLCRRDEASLGGIAGIGAKTAVSIQYRFSAIHEIGHNLSLRHVPCWYGNNVPENLDENYPNRFGSLGDSGFNIQDDGIYYYDPLSSTDIMGYCYRGLQWISAYNYRRVLRWRSVYAAPAIPEPSVLIWGEVEPGAVKLNPSFRVETVPSLPSGLGSYTVAIIGPSDEVVYESRFTPQELSVGGLTSFHFAIPYAGEIERIEVSGPSGIDVIGRGTEPPIAMWWQDGEVIAIRRFTPGLSFDRMSGGIPGHTVIISEGVPR